MPATHTITTRSLLAQVEAADTFIDGEVTDGEAYETRPHVLVTLDDGRKVVCRIDSVGVRTAFAGREGCLSLVIEASEV